ncbi:MAG: AAA family ATPase [Pseudomonadales bacterium]
MSAAQDYVKTIEERLAERVFGMASVTRLLAMTRIAGGHALLQGPPGIGKTLLARSMAEVLGGDFQRIQGTPDLLPGDMTGVTVYRPDGSEFVFRPGPLFADVVLVDEINRAGPKTQSALLEAMEERRITLDGETRPLPENFLVIATQNPLDFEGTYPLPESQIDRFLIRADISYADATAEAEVLARYALPASPHQQSLAAMANEPTALAAARSAVSATRISRTLIDYVIALCDASRRSEDIALGLSTRAARALMLMARVHASANGFDFVRPDDVQAVAGAVAGHRLVLSPEVTLAGTDSEAMLQSIISAVPVPRIEGEVPTAAGDQLA